MANKDEKEMLNEEVLEEENASSQEKENIEEFASSEDSQKEVLDEITELKNKINELEDKLLREKAEAINYRRRLDEEKMRLLRYANEELVLEILPVLDNFERAISMDDDNLDDEVSRFLEGFKMIYEGLKKGLERFDVVPIAEKNQPFDPSCHEAVATECVSGVEPNMVIDILQKGYKLKDKVIRPAIVKVSE